MKKLFMVVLTLALLVSGAYAKNIKIGVLVDESGPTGDVGKPYGEGIRDCVQWFNDNGGINGNEIELIYVDYGYKIPAALSAYKKFKRERVVAIHGWGTGDTENLIKMVTRDKIPYFSASYSDHLTHPDKAPYNFLVGVTYGDQVKIGLKYIKEQGGDNKDVSFIYNDTGFGRAPFFPIGEDYAKELGLKVVDKQVVDLKALDATSQLLNLSKANPGYAFIQETYMAASTILKDAKKLGIETQFIGLNWTFGQKLVELVGEASNGFMGTNAFTLWHQTDVKGIKFLHELNKKYHPDVTYRKVNYIQGFTSMYVLLHGIKKAGGDYDGDNLKSVYENMSNFDTMGLTSPVSFSKESHKGVHSLKLYRIENGELNPFTDYITAE
ncbi:ABC transporter substrate-binding protein [Limisalsivibrio acetivorans]|uniref:ABC transporter substrate-binding protein n=1 Tax=Limisalsivibrio acetivorans TaxID=1304888 RepID=UPI0003B664B2|nr:ABC transporter substrate-binding protein [Limisalsivibrio acetivorans]